VYTVQYENKKHSEKIMRQDIIYLYRYTSADLVFLCITPAFGWMLLTEEDGSE